MEVWRGKGSLLDLLKKDPKVTRALPKKELDALFDLAYHLKHVDRIFRRVFGTGGEPPSAAPRRRGRVTRVRPPRRGSR
jgi:adenylosuccinate lyase